MLAAMLFYKLLHQDQDGGGPSHYKVEYQDEVQSGAIM